MWFIRILSGFYLDLIQILSGFYRYLYRNPFSSGFDPDEHPDYIRMNPFIRILSGFNPDEELYFGEIEHNEDLSGLYPDFIRKPSSSGFNPDEHNMKGTHPDYIRI